jgi:hypothetical protein
MSSSLMICLNAVGSRDSKLPHQRLYNLCGNSNRVVQKNSQKTYRRQLQRKPQAIVVSSQTSDVRQVIVVEVEELRNLILRRRHRKPTITFALRHAEKANGHK